MEFIEYIDKDRSISDALNQMDKIGRKLLIVTQNKSNYIGLLSIGDIQRYIINTGNIYGKVIHALGRQNIVANIDDDINTIKESILKHRIEYMPLLCKDQKTVKKIIYWEEVVDTQRSDKNIIKKSLNCPIVIMAGGLGTRMRPITSIIPKPLIPILDRPIIQVIMDQFHSFGSNEFYISVNYKSEMIKHYLENQNLSYNVLYFKENNPLGTAGSLSLIKDRLKQTFFVSNCDILIDADYNEIYNYHKQKKNELTIVAALKTHNVPYGTLDITKDGQLIGLKEKPNINYLVNSGIYILDHHLVSEIPSNKFFHITELMSNILKRNGKIGVYPISNGSWYDIGNWEKYTETQDRIKAKGIRFSIEQ